MKKYNAPAMSGGNTEKGFAAPALLAAGVAKGLAWGVSAGAAVFGAKKAFGHDLAMMNIPALEPCLE
ncbi:MAG: hypothetical protein IJP89_06405 [Synergistaceae bacterium]|nr:hypothetical protein [Synergistaceae bacterium]MBR0257049.1 hypothetical protein [Synergistaceae bacterium]